MKIAILGYGLEGQAALAYWSDGNDITICDQNPDLPLPDGVAGQLGEHYLSGLERFDLVVRSPQIHPKFLTAITADQITSNVNEFIRVSPSRNIIGVTGTKGKGTTSTLIADMLRAAGKTVHLGGNIGVSALDMLKADIQNDDYVVLELSNFQLIDVKQSPHIAVCLMVVPEHLDWHTDFDEYVTAKQQLFAHQSADDVAVYYPNNENTCRIANASPGQRLPYCQAPGARVENKSIVIDDANICHIDELKLLGEHNWQNVCAAVTAVWQITQDTGAIKSVLTSFSGLPYRLELVHEVADVRYYNDSFGTTPETAIVALQAFPQPKIAILGGSNKGASYDELARAVVANNVRAVILIGNDQAVAIKSELHAVGFQNVIDGGDSMSAVVHAASAAAEPGDVVILSAACASFDIFRDYKDRGAQFNAAVLAL